MAREQDKVNLIREFKVLKESGTAVNGAVEYDSIVTVTLKIPKYLKSNFAVFNIHSDGYEGEKKDLSLVMKKKEKEFEDEYELELNTKEITDSLADTDYGLFYYEYAIDLTTGTLHLGGEKPYELCDAWRYGERQLLVCKKGLRSSKSIKEGIIYHIFVDRFASSGKCEPKDDVIINSDWNYGIPQYGEYPGADVKNNMFFGGDLYGIAEKLPYIASLGTSVIYLSPVFDAASNHKYDTADYLSVDSMFGGDEALKELCRKAAEYGIGIMLDGVFNHTGSDSIYFNKESKYDSVGAYESDKSEYYNWYTFGKTKDEYDCWWGVKILPRVNSKNESYRDFICNKVVGKWMDAGVSHWRIDVADELSDEFLCDFEAAVHRHNPDAQIVGEVWEDATDKVSYGKRRHYLCLGQLSSVMNYPLRDGILSYILSGNTEKLRYATETLYRRYPRRVSHTMMNFLSTHDTMRALTVLGDSGYEELTNKELSTRKLTEEQYEAAAKKLCEAYSIICGLPGIPTVFYGDEIGTEGYRDPFCRKPFRYDFADKTILSVYRQLGALRQSDRLFVDGTFEIESLTSELFVFNRILDDEKLTVLVNNSDGIVSYELSDKFVDGDGNNYVGIIKLNPREWKYLKRV